jgi:hypothetical protein
MANMEKMKVIPSYTIKQDAKNYMSAFSCTFRPYGRGDMTKYLRDRLNTEVRAAIEAATDEADAMRRITEYLEKWHAENPLEVERWKSELQKAWDARGAQVIANLEFLFQRPLPFKELTVRFSTTGICPYNFEEKWIYATAKLGADRQLRIITHELNHFMFYEYFGDLRKEISTDDFELLKESLTFFSNPESGGNPGEKALREMFASRSWKSIDEAISAGVSALKAK